MPKKMFDSRLDLFAAVLFVVSVGAMCLGLVVFAGGGSNGAGTVAFVGGFTGALTAVSVIGRAPVALGPPQGLLTTEYPHGPLRTLRCDCCHETIPVDDPYDYQVSTFRSGGCAGRIIQRSTRTIVHQCGPNPEAADA